VVSEGAWANPQLRPNVENLLSSGGNPLSLALGLRLFPPVPGENAAKIARAEAKERKTLAQIEDQERRVAARVRIAHARALMLDQKVRILQASQRLQDTVGASIDQRLISFAATRLDETLMVLRREELRNEREVLESQREEALAELGMLLGLQPGVPLRVRKGAQDPPAPPARTQQELEDEALKERADLRALKEESKPQVPSGSGLQSPAVSAAPTLPSGYQEPISSGPPAPPKPDLSELMGLVQPSAGLPGSTVTPGSVTGLAGQGRGMRGKLPHYGPSGGRDVTPSGNPIDRAGVPTKPYVLHAVDYIGDILGSSIGYGTGTAHKQYTVSGNVSDHYEGGAVDLPSSGKRLYAIGRSALIAAGMDPKKARHAKGGLYNINGWQIIFATAAPGVGDHWDHVHVAPPSGWKRPR